MRPLLALLTMLSAGPAVAQTASTTTLTVPQLAEAASLDESSLKNSVVDALVSVNFYAGPQLAGAFRLLSASRQEELVRSAFALAKAYASEEAFTEAYLNRRLENWGLAQDADNDDAPRELKLALKKRLGELAKECEQVDFAAKTRLAWGSAVFEDPKFEAKSKLWKYCYRAGPAATNAARAAASAWLAELGP